MVSNGSGNPQPPRTTANSTGPANAWDSGDTWDTPGQIWDADKPLSAVDIFRQRFPAFKDPAAYPDETIAYWLKLAECMVSAATWGCFYELGIYLWAAHELAKMRMAELADDPSGITGIMQSKSVGPVSVSYNTQLGVEEGAGHYNLTMYGRQFWRYARLMGMGPWQIGGISPSGPLTASGWMGPVYGVWPNWALIG